MIAAVALLLGIGALGAVGVSEVWQNSKSAVKYADYSRQIKSMNLNIELQECFRLWVQTYRKDVSGHSVYSYRKLGGHYENMNIFDLDREAVRIMMKMAGYDMHPSELAIWGKEYEHLRPRAKLLYRAMGAAMLRFENDYEWAKEQMKDSPYPITYSSEDQVKKHVIEVRMSDEEVNRLRIIAKELKDPKVLNNTKLLDKTKWSSFLIEKEWGVSPEDVERYDAGLLGNNVPNTEESLADEMQPEPIKPKIGNRKKKKLRKQRERMQCKMRNPEADIDNDAISSVSRTDFIAAVQSAGWIIRDMNKGKDSVAQPYSFRLNAKTSNNENIVLTIGGDTILDVIKRIIEYPMHFENVIASSGKQDIYLHISKKTRHTEKMRMENVVKNQDEVFDMLDDLASRLDQPVK